MLTPHDLDQIQSVMKAALEKQNQYITQYIQMQFHKQKLYIDDKFSELSHQLLEYTNIIYDNHDEKILDHDKRITQLESMCVNDK